MIDFTGDTWGHIAHQVVKPFFLNAWWVQVGAGIADCLVRLVIRAPKRTGRADIHTTAAKPAHIGLHIKRSADTAFFAPTAKSDGLRHHLLGTHSHAQSAEYAVLMLLSETLPADAIGRCQILNGL